MTRKRDRTKLGVAVRLCLPADLLGEEGIVHLNEPQDADPAELASRLLDGTYGRPFVIDDGTVRRLFFDLAYTQSEMTIARPHALNFAYTRMMMGFVLFLPRPRHVVVVGLGGGSLTKFCLRHLGRTRVTTVEIDPDVIGFADLFHLPEQHERYALIHANAVDYFAATKDRADVVLLDGCDQQGIAPDFCDERFYRNIRACLRSSGLLVMNLVGSAQTCSANLRTIREVFADDLIVQKVADGGTQVVFAFNDASFVPDWPDVQRRSRQVTFGHDLGLADLALKLRRSVTARTLER